MGNYPAKASQIVKAQNYHQHSLDDSSFSVFNIHRASGLGGALVEIIVLLLRANGYSLAIYNDYSKKCRVRAITSLETKLPGLTTQRGGHGGKAKTQITLYLTWLQYLYYVLCVCYTYKVR